MEKVTIVPYLVLHLTKNDFIVGFLGWFIRAVYDFYNAYHKVNFRVQVGVARQPFRLREYIRQNYDTVAMSAICGLVVLFILPEVLIGVGIIDKWNTGFSGLLGLMGFEVVKAIANGSRRRLALLEAGGALPTRPGVLAEQFSPDPAEEAPAPGPEASGVVPTLLLLLAVGLGSCAGHRATAPPVSPLSTVGLLIMHPDSTPPQLPAVARPAALPVPDPPKGVLGRLADKVKQVFTPSPSTGPTKYKNVTINVSAINGNNNSQTQAPAAKNSQQVVGDNSQLTDIDKNKAAAALAPGSTVLDNHGATNAAIQQGGTGNKLEADQKAEREPTLKELLLGPAGKSIGVLVIGGAIACYVWGYLPKRRKREQEADAARVA